MSRVGKRPVEILSGVKVNISGQDIEITGPKGTLKRTFHPNIFVENSQGKILVKRKFEDKFSRSLHGLTRMLIENMVKGVTEGYEKRLVITGVGYRAQLQGKTLTMQLGFSHPAVYEAAPGVELKLDKQNTIVITGIDKELVGEVAAQIRRIRPTEPYKGRGIKYEGEYIKRKVGKKTI